MGDYGADGGVMSERDKVDVMDGIVPGCDSVTFAGKTYELREPPICKAPEAIAVLVEFYGLEEQRRAAEEAIGRATSDGKKAQACEKLAEIQRQAMPAQFKLSVRLLECMGGDIAADLEHIKANAGMSELLPFLVKAVQLVAVPLESSAASIKVAANASADA